MPGYQNSSGDGGMENILGVSGDQWPGLKRRGLTGMRSGHAEAGFIQVFAEIYQHDLYTSFLVRARLVIVCFGQLFMQIAFTRAGHYCSEPVFTEMFGYKLPVHRIINHGNGHGHHPQ